MMMTVEERFMSHVSPEPTTGCWLWTASSRNDRYGRFGVDAKTHKYAHRVSWEMNYGPIPDGMLVCHKCDTPACVNPRQDMAKKGRAKGGAKNPIRAEKHYAAKVTWAIAEYVRSESLVRSQISIALELSLSPMTISRIVSNKRWVRP